MYEVGTMAAANLARNGYILDLNDTPYIKLSKPWWDQGANRDLEVQGKMYYTTGDISLADNRSTYTLFFSKSMVDTYGLMHQNNLMHYFKLLNDNLDPSIGLGYHAHNNFQMGYANCIAMLANKIDRTMIVDGSIYGMGKSAGNAPLELIAMHMNNVYGKKYQISQILEAIDSNIVNFYQSATWGYNVFYYLAASNDCHPSYVSYLMDKKTLSVKSINEILGCLQGEKKLLYDKNYIEELYVNYQINEINDDADTARLKEALAGKDILVLGPGASIKKQKKEIAEYIEERKPVVISINFASDNFRPDYIFLSNSKRYVQLATKLSRESYSVIATSNVTGTSPEAFDYVLNFSSLMDADAEFIDNSLAMMLKALIRFDCKKVTLAGFDGYSARRTNFFASGMEYDFIKKKADDLNAYMTAFLESVKDKILITKMTDPGWVFLLAEAKGVVSEKGSLLSHTAIISRELGIPAVVGIDGLMSTVKTGDVVRLDGATGIVKILRSA
jgi:4-hydroxy 2-oxovalerate aldolase